MTWYEDLRHIEWNGAQYTVLDKVEEEGRTCLGLARFEDVAEVAAALNAGLRRPLPSDLVWVEEKGTGCSPLSRKDVDRILKQKGARAMESFRKK